MQDDMDMESIDTGASEAAPEPAAAAQAALAERPSRRHAENVNRAEDPQDWHKSEPSGVVKRRGKGIAWTDSARDAFKKAAEDLKTQYQAGGAIDPMDDLDLGDDVEPPKRLPGDSAADAPAASEPPTAAKSAEKPAAEGTKSEQLAKSIVEDAAPAPSLDPAVLDEKRRLQDFKRELDEREQQLAARENGTDVQRFHDAYVENGTQATVDYVKRSLGLEKDEDIKTEIADLVSALSAEVLGVTLPPEIRAEMDRKRTVRIVKQHEKRLAERERQLEQKQAEAQRAATIRQFHQSVDSQVRGAEGAKQWAWLSKESNPGEIVHDVMVHKLIQDAIAIDPTIAQKPTKDARLRAAEALHDQGRIQLMHWTEAASKGDAYLKKSANDYYASRKDLLQPTAVAETPKTETKPAPSVQQGDPTGIQGSRTLTNKAASQPSAPPAPKPVPTVEENGVVQRGRHWNRDQWRANTRRTLRSAFRDSGDSG